MPIAEKYLVDFEEDCIYHVYNRTNNRENLFSNDRDRLMFLNKYHEFLSLVSDTYCWNLLSNHFHFLTKIKNSEVIRAELTKTPARYLRTTEIKYRDNKIDLSEFVEQTFKRFFQSYAQSFNGLYERKGNLFNRPFKRVRVDKESQFTQAVIYIHANPVKHGLMDDFRNYKWSSWKELLSNQKTMLLKDELMTWFGGETGFVQTHADLVQYYLESEISIEE
jgi:putative transposase